MAKQTINVGSSANDGTGDKIRVAFQKTNANFTELYDGKIDSVVAGTNVTVDNTDPLNPIINATGGGGSQNLQQVTDIGNTTNNQINLYNWTSQNDEQTVGNFVDLNTNKNLAFQTAPLTDNRFQVYQDADGTIALTTDVTNKVPYTGATEDVNLGEFGLLTGNIEFDNTPTNIPTTAGSMVWNDTDGTVDLKLKGANVTLQIGQESVIRVVNKTATNINLLEANYQAVRVTGAQGQRLKVDLAQATTDALSAETIGLVTETINNNQEGFITTSGLIRNINTTGSLQSETWADGDILYLSPTVAGRVTKVKPTAPNHLVIIGYVIHAHATQGSIFIKVDNGYELDELHNVKIVTPANNNVLAYTSATDIWENKTVDTALGFTPANDSAVVHNTGAETIAGAKTFSSLLTMPSTGTPRILQVASSGEISGMDTSIFPSPNELIYVKGVTSAIQTQLDGKLTSATWVDYSATSTIIGFASFTTKIIRYSVVGKTVNVIIFITGVSNSATTSITLNNNVSTNYTLSSYVGGLFASTVAAVNSHGFVVIPSTSNVFTLGFWNNATSQSLTWTASGTKSIRGFFSYEID